MHTSAKSKTGNTTKSLVSLWMDALMTLDVDRSLEKLERMDDVGNDFEFDVELINS